MHRTVEFLYITGVRRRWLQAAQLIGSWDERGRPTNGAWSSVAMRAIVGSDGCPAFTVELVLDAEEGTAFQWGVEVSGADGARRWGIVTETNELDRVRCVRSFQLRAPGGGTPPQREVYYFNHSRRLGAQKLHPPAPGSGLAPRAAIVFSVWAPNARDVRVRLGQLWTDAGEPLVEAARVPALRSSPRGTIRGGYMSEPDAAGHCHGAHEGWGPIPMAREADGVWVTPRGLGDFEKFEHLPYMYEVTTDAGTRVLRTDLYSRCQIGSGATRPNGSGFAGSPSELDGTLGCSVVVDPDRVTGEFAADLWPETEWLDQEEFFEAPAEPAPLGYRLSELVIYELHVGALGSLTRGSSEPGTLADAIALLDYLVELGVNAVELLPLSEFGGGGGGWGYSTSHYFAIEYGGGGRDQYKWFIRECHRRGIAVILDVVYNHYNHDASRAEWMFDTEQHERNIYYWYQGEPESYADFNRNVPADQRGFGGYVDNLSTGFAPRYSEEMVRNMFVSSALSLAEEFRVDGFRVDQTTSIRSYNVLHANGQRLEAANGFGAKLLRELTRALRLVNPNVIIVAEDHEPWDGLTRSPDDGGLGFDAGWYADFYHHLIGDADKGSDYAKLLATAGLGDDRPLRMGYFAGALQATQGGNKVVYHESHDEAGNGRFTARTISVAVNGAPLIGMTRRVAEARCRFAAGVTLLSAGVPMFLFGEEVGTQQPFLYGRVLEHREDLLALRAGVGQQMFEYYRQLIRTRRSRPGLSSPNIDVFYSNDENRVIAFRRWGGGEELLVVATLSNRPFLGGYAVWGALPDADWREVFNSDAREYGGDGVGNSGAWLPSRAGRFECLLPASAVLVFSRTG